MVPPLNVQRVRRYAVKVVATIGESTTAMFMLMNNELTSRTPYLQ